MDILIDPSSFLAMKGAQDAARPGMDGVHFSPLADGNVLPML
jgi:hypothetical protein